MARELKNRGAQRIFACLTHILLNEQGVARIEDSPLEFLIGTDTVVNSCLRKSKKVRIVSVAPLFAEAIDRIHNRESVSPLFTKVPDKVIDSN